VGFPLRSNIFRVGSHEQRAFDRFPIQVAVLFSPNDRRFGPVFRDLFLHLDQVTGDDLAFFAVLDPPADWREAARERPWWQQNSARYGERGFTLDDLPLVNELARRFGVTWDELPALVISPNLWAAEFVTTPTSAGSIEAQLTALTDLAREWGRPTMSQIITLLEDGFGAEARYHPADDALRYAFNQFYGVLETYPGERQLDTQGFGRYLQQAVRAVHQDSNILQRARQPADANDAYPAPTGLFDALAEDVAGSLIAPATVAARAFENLRRQRDVPIVDELDEESRVILESSMTIGNLLELLADGRLPLAPLRFQRPGASGGRSAESEFDFTPGAQGVWKVVEREINLSLIQAARLSRGIEMPAFFAIHRPAFQRNCVVYIGPEHGRDSRKNLNEKDSRHKPRHEFFTLGQCRRIVDVMLSGPDERLDLIIRERLAGSLPGDFMTNWRDLERIRNDASHVAPLTRRDYELTYDLGLNSELLTPLMRLKSTLCR